MAPYASIFVQGTRVTAYGHVEIDLSLVDTMLPTEFACRILWPAFVAAMTKAGLSLTPDASPAAVTRHSQHR